LSAYQQDFYQNRAKQTRKTANIVLSEVSSYFHLNSVVDIGCGTGTWLQVAKELGAQNVKGYEGDWVPSELLDISSDEIQRWDLRNPLSTQGTYDLVIS